MKVCKKCQLIKPLTDYYSYKSSKDRLRYNCKSCCKFEQNMRRKNDKTRHNQYSKKYVSNNREFIREIQRKYFKKRYDKDPMFKLIKILRTRLAAKFKVKNWLKNISLNQYIGCSQNELKLHIESQFQPGMEWENHTLHGWHIDHIIPLSSAKNEEELYKLCHYTNLQPLWAIDNLKKSNR